MKKFFVALLALAIVAGNLFAEVSWGGYALDTVTIVGGSSATDSDITAGSGLYGLGRIFANAANDEGTFGAYIRTGLNTGGDSAWGYRSYTWWQPISQVKLQLGFYDMGINYVVGWGWHASDAEDTVAYGGYNRLGRSLWAYGGDLTGAVLALAPIEGLGIKIGVPYSGNGPEAAEVYNHIVGQIAYDIANIGQIAVTYQSGAGYRNKVTTVPGAWAPDPAKPGDPTQEKFVSYPDAVWVPDSNSTEGGSWKALWDDPTDPTKETTKTDGNGNEWKWTPEHQENDKTGPLINPGALYAQFYLTAVDKLQLNVGLKYTLPGEVELLGGTTFTITPPITAGFGAAYAVSDTFGVKARLGVSFLGSTKVETVVGSTKSEKTYDRPVEFGFDLMPYFDLGVCKVYVNMGVQLALPGLEKEQTEEQWYVAYTYEDATDKKIDAVFDWYFNPYITKSAGGGTFYAGVQLYSSKIAERDAKGKAVKKADGTYNREDIINWAIPIGLIIAF